MRRILTLDEEICLNQFSQGIHSLDKMNAWFREYELEDKKAVLQNLLNMVIQAHPTTLDIEDSAKVLGKEKSPSANILSSESKPFSKFGYRICDLPEKELINAFDILLTTLSVADNRRKNNENVDECNHWWHKDLSDETYLKTIRKQGDRGTVLLSPVALWMYSFEKSLFGNDT